MMRDKSLQQAQRRSQGFMNEELEESETRKIGEQEDRTGI